MLLTIKDGDMWDPNNWVPDDHEFRIYADDRATTFAVVDEIDYHWAIQWKWNLVRWHGGGRSEKVYLRRAVNIWDKETKMRTGVETLLLHVEIMKRTGIPQPSILHFLVDHIDDESLHCKRINLQWATYKMNNSKKRPRA